MADITIDPRNKTDLTITNRSIPADLTWDTIEGTWDEHDDTWDSPRRGTTKRTKNDLTITNRNKN